MDAYGDLLASACEDARVPGAVLGVATPAAETVTVHGVLDTTDGTQVEPDSRFQVGSVTKLYTAAVVGQLVAEGRCDLEDRVSSLLPGTRLGRDARQDDVTLAQLLSHTSGLDGDVFDDTGDDDACYARYVDLLAGVEQLFEPGAAYSYCNAGYVVLGRVVEVLTRRTWDDAVAERVFARTDAAGSETIRGRHRPAGAAAGHGEHPHEDRPADPWALPRSINPAGGVLAPVRDVLAFGRSLLLPGGGLVPEEVRRRLVARRVETPEVAPRPDAVGLGVRHHDWGGGTLVGHDGLTMGQLAFLRAHPDSGTVVALLTNGAEAGGVADRVLGEVLTRLTGLEPPAPLCPCPDPPPADDSWVGDYPRAGIVNEVRLADGRLVLTQRRTGAFAALADGEDRHVYELHPLLPDGRSFVGRRHEHEPWTRFTFGDRPGVGPHLHSGRIARRTR